MERDAFLAHPFVRTLEPAHAQALLDLGRPVQFDAGSFVFREGEVADTLFLLGSGCVALEQFVPGHGALRLESLCEGDILGLSWLFAGWHWTLDARCIEAVQAWALSGPGVRALAAADTAFRAQLLERVVQALYQRLMRVRMQRLDLYRGEQA